MNGNWGWGKMGRVKEERRMRELGLACQIKKIVLINNSKKFLNFRNCYHCTGTEGLKIAVKFTY